MKGKRQGDSSIWEGVWDLHIIFKNIFALNAGMKMF